jgi:ubiquinone biosynthesis protein
VFELFRSGRHLARLVRIGLTLARHDALFPLDGTAGIAPFLRVARLLRRSDRARGRPGERLAAALTELGPSFIKLGQLLSTPAVSRRAGARLDRGGIRAAAGEPFRRV